MCMHTTRTRLCSTLHWDGCTWWPRTISGEEHEHHGADEEHGVHCVVVVHSVVEVEGAEVEGEDHSRQGHRQQQDRYHGCVFKRQLGSSHLRFVLAQWQFRIGRGTWISIGKSIGGWTKYTLGGFQWVEAEWQCDYAVTSIFILSGISSLYDTVRQWVCWRHRHLMCTTIWVCRTISGNMSQSPRFEILDKVT